MTYVDGFVLVVPKRNFSKYKKMAQEGGKLWKKFGALGYFECMGDDLNPSGEMKVLTFPALTKMKKDETVWFSFVIYKSKAHRDQVNKRVMKEMEKEYGKDKKIEMPFDMMKMAYGGFKTIVEV